MANIPKKIHYIWLGPNQMPELSKKCLDSWIRHCPDFEILFWNEKNLNVREIKFCKEAYEKQKYGFVTDYLRLQIIHEQGGVYLDTDVELLKPLDDLLENKAFFGFEYAGCINTGLGFGSVAGNPLLKTLMRTYENDVFIRSDGTLNDKTCTLKDTQVLMQLGLKNNNKLQELDGTLFYPKEYFCPLNYDTGTLNITPNTYSIHHYMASWHTDKQKNDRKLIEKFRKKLGSRFGYVIAVSYVTFRNEGLVGWLKKSQAKLFRILGL